MSSPDDLVNKIPLDEDTMSRLPKFSASIGTPPNNNLFIAYTKDNKVWLRCSALKGASPSAELDIFDTPGNVRLLKIGSNGDIALAVAIEEDASGDLWVKGAMGKIGTRTDPDGHTISTFDPRKCPVKKLDGIKFPDILDLILRINDDGTSDDYILTKGAAGADVSHVGHHPHA